MCLGIKRAFPSLSHAWLLHVLTQMQFAPEVIRYFTGLYASSSTVISFGRALQSTSLKLWDGKDENAAAAQANLVKIAQACSEASIGEYKGGAAGVERGKPA